MPLSMVQAGETGYIRRITGKDDMRRHLIALGFVAGEKVTVISEFNNNMILSIKNSRIALDKRMANRIIV